MSRRYLLCCLGFFHTFLLCGQSATLLQSLLKSNDYSNLKKNEVIHLDFTVTCTYLSKQQSVKSSIGHIYISSKIEYVTNNEMEFIQDDKEVFVINYLSKSILRNNKAAKNQSDKFKNIAISKGKLLVDSSLVKASLDTIIGQTGFDYFVLKPNQYIKAQYKIESVKYFFYKGNKQLYKAVVDFRKGYTLKTYVIVFNKVEHNFKGINLKKVKDRYVDTKGNIRSDFKQYTLIDNRKK